MACSDKKALVTAKKEKKKKNPIWLPLTSQHYHGDSKQKKWVPWEFDFLIL